MITGISLPIDPNSHTNNKTMTCRWICFDPYKRARLIPYQFPQHLGWVGRHDDGLIIHRLSMVRSEARAVGLLTIIMIATKTITFKNESAHKTQRLLFVAFRPE